MTINNFDAAHGSELPQACPLAQKQHDQLGYWVAQLETSRPAELLCDKARPTALSGQADTQSLPISETTYKRLQDLCERLQVTPLTVLAAVFRATHYRLTGVDDATIGTVNGRGGRLQCLRVRIDGECLQDVVRQIEATTRSAEARDSVAFENIVSALRIETSAARHPLVQMVIVHDGLLSSGQEKRPRFDVECHFSEQDGALRGEVVYSTDLYRRETIASMISVFTSMLDRGLDEPTTPIAHLSLLTDDGYAMLDKMGLVEIQRTDYPRNSSVVDVLAQQVAAYGDGMAVKDCTTQLTYSQLDAASDAVCAWLRASSSLAAESLVGVFADRSCSAVVTFVGILKAGLAYLPLDVRAPSARIEAILSSVGVEGRRVVVLVGGGVSAPEVNVQHVDFVSIDDVVQDKLKNGWYGEANGYGDANGCDELSDGARDEEIGHKLSKGSHDGCPSASSLAYVMFTSGSTGKPKGVMIEHGSIVRLVKETNNTQHMPMAPVVGHMSNIAFDMSTFEIYSALLNGGTVICIPSQDVLDPAAMEATICREDIQVMVMTPPLLRHYLVECRSAIGMLHTLLLGGDVADAEDCMLALKLVKCGVLNQYGPTENTAVSTVYSLGDDIHGFASRVPIGKAVSNSGAHVMDSQQRLVPLGVIGELVVTGDGLARGYTDPRLNQDRFVTVTIGGQARRAYRTGDLVRHRPVDGQIEYFGRMDGQVKVRGHRVELAEIEHVIRSHECVREAVAILDKQDGHEARIVCFVAVRDTQDDAGSGGRKPPQMLEAWQERVDQEGRTFVSNISADMAGRDFVGWKSMYEGSDIDKQEMQEWLDDTIRTIVNGKAPEHVVEIGTGSGMILFNLRHGLKSYTGLEPSQPMVEYVAEMARSTAELAGKTTLYQATAAEVGQIDAPQRPCTVVVNSVAQYFDCQAYLERVVDDVVRLPGVTTVIFGDVRSLALHDEFLVTRALHACPRDGGLDEVARTVAAMRRAETELLVDAAFFTALPDRMPGVVEHVEILPKVMRATNELSAYRYAAVLHVAGRGEAQTRRIHRVGDDEWVDFMKQGLHRQSLVDMLLQSRVASQGVVSDGGVSNVSNGGVSNGGVSNGGVSTETSPEASTANQASPPILAISNIPYSKTLVERNIVSLLHGRKDDKPAPGHDWLSAARLSADNCPSLSAHDLFEIASQTGHGVEVSWARQHSQQGGLDAIFHRIQRQDRVLFRFPHDHEGRPYASLTNQPQRQQRQRKTQKQLLDLVRARLPSYMVPHAIHMVDSMPLNANSKTDVGALGARRRVAPKAHQQPQSQAERDMHAIWARVLDTQSADIGLHDGFLDLGGDSMTAMRIVGQARQLGMRFTVADVLRHDSIYKLVRAPATLNGGAHQPEHGGTGMLDQTELVDASAKAAILGEIDSRDDDLSARDVKDIYPVTDYQQELLEDAVVSKRLVWYFYIDVAGSVDMPSLQQRCAATLESIEILRSCFLQFQDRYWQVVLHRVKQPIYVHDVDGSLDNGLHDLVARDDKHLTQSHPPFALILFRQGAKCTRLVLRLAHAQFDGVCGAAIFQRLVNDVKTVPQAPSFSHFLSYAAARRSHAIAYWTNLLRGSTFTWVLDRLGPGDEGEPQPIRARAHTQLARSPVSVTTASLVSAAWAVTQSRICGTDDVVFGRLVSGRNAALDGIETIVGCCLNIVPVRVTLASAATTGQLLRQVHEQFMAMGDADSLGFLDIINLCTDWTPDWGIFDPTMWHQNVDERPVIEVPEGDGVAHYPQRFYQQEAQVPHYVDVTTCASRAGLLEVRVDANTGFMRARTACALADVLARVAGRLAACAGDEALGPWLDGLDVGELSA